MFPGVHAVTSPDRPAVVMSGSGRSLTYRELNENSAKFARVLHDLGLRKGDVFAFVSDNAPECFELYWAALRSGLYVTPVNRNLSPTDAAFIIHDSDSKVLVVSAGVRALAEALVPLTPQITNRFCFGGPIAGYRSYEAMRANAGVPLVQCPRGSDLLYAASTTGRLTGMKPPLLPIEVDQPGDPNTMAIGMAYRFTFSDVYLTPSPIDHDASLRWCGAVHAYGGTVVMMEKFDAEQVLQALETHFVTVAQMEPAMFVRMLQLSEAVRAKYDLSSLRSIVHAAAPCPPVVKKSMIDWVGMILNEYYSPIEGNGFTTISSGEWLARPRSVGRSALGTLHICDDEGTELPAGEVGTVYFEREVAPFEYHKDLEKTASTRHPDYPTWTAVGDHGFLDVDGYLFLADRSSAS
ncbi:AMP-binding protein [Rhodococcus sp. USK13]|uniref:AMP-binding protein n=1 Tax=Rhodococcus sp. USK13 TaxID=2806442 RepID=UPI0024B4BA54|nr:AMP-binding protein [Rhodococcus sp. USK13]